MVVTGIEIAGLCLATFPIIVSTLEHYQNGFHVIKEWIRFEREFKAFVNEINREKIFFRQNIEELMAPIVSSEHTMAQLLESPGSIAWTDPNLEKLLKERLSGHLEYECYVSTVVSLLDTLNELKRKLKIQDGQLHWAQKEQQLGRIKLQFMLRKFSFALDKKRREALLSNLGKHNREIKRLLGNSQRLEPLRRKRKSPFSDYFQQVRNQACSLHNLFTGSHPCQTCQSPHSTKLLLESRVKSFEFGKSFSSDESPIKFNIFICPESHAEGGTPVIHQEEWEEKCEVDIQMLEIGLEKLQASAMPHDVEPATRPKVILGRRRVAFADENLPTSLALAQATKALDICSMLKAKETPQPGSKLGFLEDTSSSSLYNISAAIGSWFPDCDEHRIVSLDAILKSRNPQSGFPVISRRTRLSIAITISSSLLQLYSSPWLNPSFSARDVYFFQSSSGDIDASHPFLVSRFFSPMVKSKQTPEKSSVAYLLSLGVLILELWFANPLQSLPFYRSYFGADGQPNEYTLFNTAQKWQEQALEEAGLDLHSLTRRCIYCAFGPPSQNLENAELKDAIWEGVIAPLERIRQGFEEVGVR
ncbi:MAG: hypothetical protein M1814_000570 [Vezdaea aestivalis]|nr:MAG: hypothetical protein M1814_000570 [Vezdaea aestivalis]